MSATNDEMLSALSAVIRKTNAYPSLVAGNWEKRFPIVAEWEGFRLLSPQLYRKRFGSVEAAVQQACKRSGVPMPPGARTVDDVGKSISKSEMISTMATIAHEIGEMPHTKIGGARWNPETHDAADRLGLRLPSPSSVQARFGNIRSLMREVKSQYGLALLPQTSRQLSAQDVQGILLAFHRATGHFPRIGENRAASEPARRGANGWSNDTNSKAALQGLRLPGAGTIRARFDNKTLRRIWQELEPLA